MPRDLIAEIRPILARLLEQIKEFLQRRGLLQTAQQTQDAELELAAVGRGLADEVMEQLLAASIAALQTPGQPSSRRRAELPG